MRRAFSLLSRSLLLLAASRTVIEGDSFSVCHRLFAVPGTVHLVPQPLDAETEAMHIFVGADGLVTIESTACYRCVSIARSVPM